MTEHKLKRGLDLPLIGGAAGKPVELPPPSTVAYSPEEFAGIFPKLVVKAGDRVERGSVLFFNKYAPEMKFLSPVAGTVKEIRRGERRVVTDLVIEREGDAAVAMKRWSMADLQRITSDEARKAVGEGGLWAAIRTRPLDLIADFAGKPQAILVYATETGPLMPKVDVLLGEDDGEALQAGLYALKAMTEGKLFLTVPTGCTHKALTGLQGIEVHAFGGKHPSGDPAVQINHLSPPTGPGRVWYVAAWDVALMGKMLLNGCFPAERVYAAVGSMVEAPRYVRTLLGAPVAHILGAMKQGDKRILRGSVLTGTVTTDQRFASFYKRAISVIPDTAERELFGWTTPQFNKFSVARNSFVGLVGVGRTLFDMTTQIFGGHRAMIPLDLYADVVQTPDIQPEFLFRSILTGDNEDAISLGLLDISMEEAALMTFVCPTKNEYGVALSKALAQYIKES